MDEWKEKKTLRTLKCHFTGEDGQTKLEALLFFLKIKLSKFFN